MTADVRAALAREYLDGARKRKVTELPPSLLVRECAELRRQLGQLLDVLDGDGGRVTVLSEGQEAIILDALAVAAEYRRYRASLTCQACNDHPAELCEDHQADLDAADACDDLAAQLGGAR